MILIISPKEVYFSSRLAEELLKQKVQFEILDIQDLINCNFKVNINKYTVLYVRFPYFNGSPMYIPKILNLAKQFKLKNKKVIDSTILKGKIANGKWFDYKLLRKFGMQMPLTKQFGKKTLPKKWPFILKWIYGFKSKQVFFVNSQYLLNFVFKKFNFKELLVQKFIKADYEYKVITIGFKTLPVVLKFKVNASGFGVDFANFKVIKSTQALKIVKMAEKASKILGKEIAKTDILESKGKYYILEVNRFPGLESFEKLTKYNVMSHIASYLQK